MFPNNVLISLVYHKEHWFIYLKNRKPFILSKAFPQSFFRQGATGMCAYKDNVFISCAHSNSVFRMKLEDYKLDPVLYLQRVGRKLHDLKIWKEDEDFVYIISVDTEHDQLKLIQYNKKTGDMVGGDFMSWAQPQRNLHHFNTIHFYKDKAFLTAAHRDDPNKNRIESDVLEIDLENQTSKWLDIKSPNGDKYLFAHDYCPVSEDEYIICDSYRGRVVCGRKSLGLRGWTRGLAKIGDNLLIGSSPFRTAYPDHDFKECGKQIDKSTVFLVNRDLDILDKVKLPVDQKACIYSIQIMEDDSHQD